MKAASFIKIAFFINKSKRDLGVEVCCATELRAERWYAVPKGAETAGLGRFLELTGLWLEGS